MLKNHEVLRTELAPANIFFFDSAFNDFWASIPRGMFLDMFFTRPNKHKSIILALFSVPGTVQSPQASNPFQVANPIVQTKTKVPKLEV